MSLETTRATSGDGARTRVRNHAAVLVLTALAMVGWLLPTTTTAASADPSDPTVSDAGQTGRATAIPVDGGDAPPPPATFPSPGTLPSTERGLSTPAAELWDPGPGIGGDYVYFDGTAGDTISQGEDRLYTPVFSDLSLSESGRQIDVNVQAEGESWTVRMVAPTTQDRWVSGFYPGVQESPGGDATKGLLQWSGQGRTCSDVTGWVSVDELVRSGGAITKLVVRFEQSCNGGPAAHGKIVLGTARPALPPGSPFGSLSRLSIGPGGVTLDGWAIDPDVASPIPVYVFIDEEVYVAWADQPLSVVANTWPSYSAYHGYSLVVPATPGRHDVCVGALNVGAGDDALISCQAVDVPGPSPFGSLDVARAVPGGVQVGGWAIDSEVEDSIPVHVYVDGRGTAITADGYRSDLDAIYPAYGGAHGFATTVSAGPGSHQVCVYGINVGAGGNVLLGCRTVVVPGGSPIGSLDVARQGPQMVAVAGWALDFDTINPIDVHVYVDGKGVAVTANGSRPDVGAAYGGYGSAHGFSVSIPATPGPHDVCVYAINTGAGANAVLGCRTISVSTGSPIGTIDVIRGGPGWVSVGGWALDADTGAPIPVHVYVDGKGTALTANGNRPDVGAFFQGWGDAHGYATTISTTPGNHQVCVYGINVGPGANSLLGCRTVTVT